MVFKRSKIKRVGMVGVCQPPPDARNPAIKGFETRNLPTFQDHRHEARSLAAGDRAAPTS